MASNNVRFIAKNGVDNNGKTLANVNTPVNTTDAANKGYVDASLANKEPSVAAGTSAQYYRGDKTFQTLDKTVVGLTNVDNTTDLNKPVSTATTTALALKVDKVAGKGLSTEDYTTVEKTKLAAISGTNTGDQTTITGNAGSATVFQTARAINGVNFDGSANITINAVDSTARIASSLIGAASGVCPLGADSKVSATYLPSYVDDVLEYANLAGLPASGATGVIYVTLDTNKIYRWSGSAYIEVSPTAGNADTATKLATARTIAMTGDVTYTSAAFDGSASVTATATLATITDSGTGTFKKVTVNSKGLVTGTASVAQADITSLLGAGSISNTMLANSAVANLSNTNTGDETLATIKTKLGISTLSGSNTGDQTITLTGDVTGTGTGSFAATLANSGVSAGTYSAVTVDAKGRVTAGSNTVGLAHGTLLTAALTTSAVTANQVLVSLSATTYRTVKVVIQATSGTSYHAAEVLVIHDGTTPTINEYAQVFTGVSLIAVDADVTGGNLRLLITPTNAVTTIKAVISTINV